MELDKILFSLFMHIYVCCLTPRILRPNLANLKIAGEREKKKIYQKASKEVENEGSGRLEGSSKDLCGRSC